MLLIVPYLVAVTLFHLGPTLFALLFSFSRFEGGKPSLFAAGISNYAAVFSDPALWEAYSNVIKFSLIATTMGFIGSVGVALLLTLTRDTVAGFARSVFFLPNSINGPVVALIFIFMLDPAISPFGFLFQALGWSKTADFVNARNATIVMAVIRFYLMSGSWIAIFCAALESVSQELLDAGKIDGCGPWRLAWSIRRPAIMGFVWFQVIQLIAINMQIFAEPYIIGQALGGSSFIGPLWSPNMLGAFYTQQLGDFGRSAVVSLSQVAITLASSVFIITKTNAFTTDVAD